jgi:polyisoprenyl-phosphate glycosyltransferase
MMHTAPDADEPGDSGLSGKTIAIMMATYNDWRSVAHLLPELDKQILALGARAVVVIVDDGSVDLNGHDEILGMSYSAIDSVDKVTLTRNFGNQRAVAIGVAHVAKNINCDYLVVMDSDLEDRPEDVPRLLGACADGGSREIIFAERRKRPEGIIFQAMYTIYKQLYRLLTGLHMTMGNFSVVPGPLVRRIAHVDDIWVHYPAGIVRSKLPIQRIPIDKGTRLFGESKMRLENLILHAFGGFSVFADHVAVRFLIGMLWCIGVFLAAVAFFLWEKYILDVATIGWTSQIVAILLAIMLQIIVGTVLLIFVILARKTQPPLIPIETYPSFVLESQRLYPAGD